jgi:hypothetical protein
MVSSLILTATSMKMTVFGIFRDVFWYILTDVSDELTTYIISAISRNAPNDRYIYFCVL